ncbi:MAG: restriction endonuclease [Nitrosarchaeum sp.]|nr:restriction endonuclease [Nitrosarchaeum sp.]
MAIPKFNETMLPILQELSINTELSMQELADNLLSKYFTLTEEEKREQVSNGYTRFFDRVGWGRTYLKKAGLVIQRKRGGNLSITEEGRKVLESNPKEITVDLLKQYPSFVSFKSSGSKESNEIDAEFEQRIMERFTPQDFVDIGFNNIMASLESDLLEKLQNTNPYFFEKVVLILFQKMGYGDFQETPKSGDGGVDGIISQDKLGLEKIYIQAKRYATENKVREPAIRNFIGAMSGGVHKGIFVTTSSFDEGAMQKARDAHNHKIILIDGAYLTELMIKNNVGVQAKTVYEVKELDNDFFEE